MKQFSKYFCIVFFLTVGVATECYAKEFKSSLRSLQSEIEQIGRIAGVISLILAGLSFYLSKQKGLDMLTASLFGVVIFCAAPSIYGFLERSFA